MRVPYTACPLCASGDFARYKTADATKHPFYNDALPATIEWEQCGACKHIFTSGYWTDEALGVLFSGATHSYQTVSETIRADVSVLEKFRTINAKIVDRVSTFAFTPRDGIWLDVGFGNGSLLFTADEFGYKTHGLDLRGDNVDAMVKLGFDATAKTVQEFSCDYDGKFSIVSLADLIEHTPFPIDTLYSSRRLLRDDGVLFVSCPNSETIVWRAMGDSNPYWFEIEHFHCFSRSRLTSLLKECGFKVLHYGISERYLSCMELICVAA